MVSDVSEEFTASIAINSYNYVKLPILVVYAQNS
jgi:hypothetical protein